MQMTANFTLLGSGGWIPTARRETTCAILSLPEALFIFDAGTGLARLLEERFRPEYEAAREVHLFLSHYHLDHIAGLVYLLALFIEPLAEGEHAIGGASVQVRKQIHADPSVAFRVNDWLVFATDGSACI